MNSLFFIPIIIFVGAFLFLIIEAYYYIVRQWYLSFPAVFCEESCVLKKEPGCYILLRKEKNGRDTAIYVGQSVNLNRRIREHLSGHGKIEVFIEYKMKNNLYVIPVYCRLKKMNMIEKRLIRAFRTRRYYNIQRGGAKRR